MKIRIKGDTIRLRLSQTEVSDIGVYNDVVETTHFGESELMYRLTSQAQANSITASFENNEITVVLPQQVAQNWANSDTVGVESAKDAIPYILIEKDFQCLTVRQGEDESDLFQNPNTTC